MPAVCRLPAGADASERLRRWQTAAPGAPGAEAGATAPGAPAEPPPEKEVESDYEAPVATGRFVWVANPKSGRVALRRRDDAAGADGRGGKRADLPRERSRIERRHDARPQRALRGRDAAPGRRRRASRRKTFKIAKQANSLAFSSDGHFAIAWADARKVPTAPRTEGFQDLTVLDLARRHVHDPRGRLPARLGRLRGGPAARLRRHAGRRRHRRAARRAARHEERRHLRHAERGPGLARRLGDAERQRRAHPARRPRRPSRPSRSTPATRTTITLPGPVTDLDLDDKGDRAVAVVRSTSQVAVLPIPGILGAPATFTTVTRHRRDHRLGRALARRHARALLYTNAVARSSACTILDLSAGPAAVPHRAPLLAGARRLQRAGRAHAVVLHDKTPGRGDGRRARRARSASCRSRNALPAKIVATQAPPTAVAVTNDRAVVAERDDATKIFGAYLARMPQLMVERYPLASPPIAVGVVAGAKRAFVAQQHPDGRLTFIDLETRRGAHAHRLRAVLARRRREQAMKKRSDLVTVRSLGASPRAAIARTSSTRPSAQVRAFGLEDASRVVDDGAHRVVLLTPRAEQELDRTSVAVGKGVIRAEASPDGKRLFVLSTGDLTRKKGKRREAEPHGHRGRRARGAIRSSRRTRGSRSIRSGAGSRIFAAPRSAGGRRRPRSSRTRTRSSSSISTAPVGRRRDAAHAPQLRRPAAARVVHAGRSRCPAARVASWWSRPIRTSRSSISTTSATKPQRPGGHRAPHERRDARCRTGPVAWSSTTATRRGTTTRASGFASRMARTWSRSRSFRNAPDAKTEDPAQVPNDFRTGRQPHGRRRHPGRHRVRAHRGGPAPRRHRSRDEDRGARRPRDEHHHQRRPARALLEDLAHHERRRRRCRERHGAPLRHGRLARRRVLVARARDGAAVSKRRGRLALDVDRRACSTCRRRAPS